VSGRLTTLKLFSGYKIWSKDSVHSFRFSTEKKIDRSPIKKKKLQQLLGLVSCFNNYNKGLVLS